MANARDKYITLLRKYIQDDPIANKLTGKFENPDLGMYLDLALSDFNMTPPLIGDYTFEKFPAVKLLIMGAVVQILLSNSILQVRNSLSYSDGGSTIAIFEKGPAYMQGAQVFAGMYENNKKNLKISLNIQKGWGTVSPMQTIDTFTLEDDA
ncbi:MAG: hypothetical protein SVK08_01860 [Halobacteriota archaeon]|nr:hypothetical protein [Halobacteriota archaeon]